MLEYFRYIIKLGNYGTPAGARLYEIAKLYIGRDIAPTQNEYGCAESVNNVCYKAFGDYVGGDISSYRMYLSIINNRKFVQVKKPIIGDIIISPTGFRTHSSSVANGHVGIVSEDGKIMSNDSETGLWLEKYTLSSWDERYRINGHYPIYYFRRLTY